MKRLVLPVISLILIIVAFVMSSANNHHVTTLVATVISDDQPAQNAMQAVPDSSTDQIAAIKQYIHGHWGTMAKFTLSGAYQQAVTAAQAAANAQSANAQVYAAAQAACSGKTDSITQAKCNEDYLAQHLVTMSAPAPVVAPNIADYQYNLKSPLWTADSAGILLLLGLLGLIGSGFLLLRRR